MKPIADKRYVTEGTLTGESIEFGFDSKSLGHLQFLLSDLYSNPYIAVLRELATNALDAQVDAGYVGPIEVFTPNALSNTALTVVDHGVGMSVDDLHRIYTKYGASTKRESNDFVGTLGIGSKSPLAISSQFTVTTVHDGVKIEAFVKKNEKGVGELVIFDTSSTDEPNGTTIKVPTNASSRWDDIATNLFKFWEPGTVLVNGEQPETIEGCVVDENLTITSLEVGTGTDYLVMGNIAYPIKFESSNRLFRNHNYQRNPLVITVPIGSVQFAPTREALTYSDTTNAFLEELSKDVYGRIRAYFKERIEECESADEAFLLQCEWRSSYQRFTYELPTRWRGNEIPDSLPLEGYILRRERYRKRIFIKKVSSIDTNGFTAGSSYLFVTGYSSDEAPKISLKRRLSYYMQENGISEYSNVFFVKTLTDPLGWLDSVPRVTVAELQALKMPRVQRESGGSAKRLDTWDVIEGGVNCQVGVDDLPDEYYYVSPTCYGTHRFSSLRFLVNLSGATVVEAPKNRWGRLLRENPNGKHVSELLTELTGSIAFTEEERYNLFAKMPPTLEFLHREHKDALVKGVEDKELLEHLSKYENSRYINTDNITAREELTKLGFTPVGETFSIGSDYPLLGNLETWRGFNKEKLNHVILYINTVYRMMGKEKVAE